jgi:hypothetical protein
MDEKKIKVDQDILIYAMRYAIDRKTFAPLAVLENIKHNDGKLSERFLACAIRDLQDDLLPEENADIKATYLKHLKEQLDGLSGVANG